MNLFQGSVLRIFASEADREALSLQKTERGAEADEFDYSGVVVNKPWGYEYLMYQNAFVAVWILNITAQNATSLHCHIHKKTSLIVLDGTAMTSTLDGRYLRHAMEGIILEPGVFHSTRAISPEGIFLMEIESPPDKLDLVRLRDAYGRKGAGYETTSHYSTDFSAYQYCAFHENFSGSLSKSFGKITIAIHRPNLDQRTAWLDPIWTAPGFKTILGLYQGGLHDAQGDAILKCGDVCRADNLKTLASLQPSGKIEVLTIQKGRDHED